MRELGFGRHGCTRDGGPWGSQARGGTGAPGTGSHGGPRETGGARVSPGGMRRGTGEPGTEGSGGSRDWWRGGSRGRGLYTRVRPLRGPRASPDGGPWESSGWGSTGEPVPGATGEPGSGATGAPWHSVTMGCICMGRDHGGTGVHGTLDISQRLGPKISQANGLRLGVDNRDQFALRTRVQRHGVNEHVPVFFI